MKLPLKLNKARKLSDDDIRGIVQMRKMGESLRTIAGKYKVDRSAVLHHIYKALDPQRYWHMEQLKMARNVRYKDKEKESLRAKDRLKRLKKHFGDKKLKNEWHKRYEKRK